MQINAHVEIDDMDFKLENDRVLIEGMARKLSRMVKMRTHTGRGADGKIWPAPKDNPTQAPLQRSGQLVDSISFKLRKNKKFGTWTANVQSKPGRRTDATTAKSKAAKGRTSAARASATAAYEQSGILHRGAKITKGGKLSVSGVKRHAVRTNGNLAAILSVAARDSRSKGREKYRIYEATGRELNTLFGMAKTKIKPKITRAKGSRRR